MANRHYPACHVPFAGGLWHTGKQACSRQAVAPGTEGDGRSLSAGLSGRQVGEDRLVKLGNGFDGQYLIDQLQ